jgi:hypothetical protein
MLLVSALAFLAVCADLFDLKTGILGEWELFNRTDPSFPAYTVEFHRSANRESIVGSFWLNDPGKPDLDDALSSMVELAFASPTAGLVLRSSPARSKFATFSFAAREGGWPIELSGTFSGKSRYHIELANLTTGVLSIEGTAAFDFCRVLGQTTSVRRDMGSLYWCAVIALPILLLSRTIQVHSAARTPTRAEREKRARQKKDDDVESHAADPDE